MIVVECCSGNFGDYRQPTKKVNRKFTYPCQTNGLENGPFPNQEIFLHISEYNITVSRPSDAVDNQCSRWLAICADQNFHNYNSLLSVFITCIITSILKILNLKMK